MLTVPATATYLPGPNGVRITHAVGCPCGADHLFYASDDAPILRKPPCGMARYRIVPAASLRVPRPRRSELAVSA